LDLFSVFPFKDSCEGFSLVDQGNGLKGLAGFLEPLLAKVEDRALWEEKDEEGGDKVQRDPKVLDVHPVSGHEPKVDGKVDEDQPFHDHEDGSDHRLLRRRDDLSHIDEVGLRLARDHYPQKEVDGNDQVEVSHSDQTDIEDALGNEREDHHLLPAVQICQSGDEQAAQGPPCKEGGP